MFVIVAAIFRVLDLIGALCASVKNCIRSNLMCRALFSPEVSMILAHFPCVDWRETAARESEVMYIKPNAKHALELGLRLRRRVLSYHGHDVRVPFSGPED